MRKIPPRFWMSFIEFFRGRGDNNFTSQFKCARPFIQSVKSTLSYLKSCRPLRGTPWSTAWVMVFSAQTLDDLSARPLSFWVGVSRVCACDWLFSRPWSSFPCFFYWEFFLAFSFWEMLGKPTQKLNTFHHLLTLKISWKEGKTLNKKEEFLEQHPKEQGHLEDRGKESASSKPTRICTAPFE